MPDSSVGWRFERGLDSNFMEQLKTLAESPGWFADVLADHDLIIGIRNNYVNVYRLGQSLFKIERKGKTGSLKVSTHPKYLLDPDLSSTVSFDGSAFAIEKHRPMLSKYAGVQTLKQMKRAAKLYCGYEKVGVHAIAVADHSVIDTEVAFSCKAENEEEGRFAPRIDLACFEEDKGTIWLRFWEAKLYTNAELRAAGNGDALVVGQVRGYRDLIEEHRDELVQSYRMVARNLVEMGRWTSSRRHVGGLVQRVAAGDPLEIDNPPKVGLVIYDYDDAQKRSVRWKTDIGKLRRETLMPVQCAGSAKSIKLRGTDSRLSSLKARG